MDPFIYQYLVGGVVFLVGTIYGIKQGYIGTQGKSLRNLILILAGLGFFAGVQGYLQYGTMKTADPCPYPCQAQQEGRSPKQLEMVQKSADKIAVQNQKGTLKSRLKKKQITQSE